MRTASMMLLTALIAAPGLMAQDRGTPEAAKPPVWEISLGAGAVVTPSYAGAEESRLMPIPITQITWRGRVYLGSSATGQGAGLGAYIIRSRHFQMAAEAGFLYDRPADRADALAGMEDRDLVGTASVALAYSLGPIQATIGATHGLNDNAGTLGTAGLSFTQALGERTSATLGAGATFADRRQMRWDFGVTRTEAARRQALIDQGDDRLHADEGRPYSPDAGLRNLSASLSVMQGISDHWALFGFGSFEWLSDEAEKSPLVRKREQFSGGAGLGYRF